jgi:ribosome production factor 2
MKSKSLKKPKGLEPTKLKNVTRNVFGEKIGRLHMQRQDMDTLQTRKMKGLKVSKKDREEQEDEGEEDD